MTIGSQTLMTVIWVSWDHLEPGIEFPVKRCKYFGKAMHSFLPVMLFYAAQYIQSKHLDMYVQAHRHTQTNLHTVRRMDRHTKTQGQTDSQNSLQVGTDSVIQETEDGRYTEHEVQNFNLNSLMVKRLQGKVLSSSFFYVTSMCSW